MEVVRSPSGPASRFAGQKAHRHRDFSQFVIAAQVWHGMCDHFPAAGGVVFGSGSQMVAGHENRVFSGGFSRDGHRRGHHVREGATGSQVTAGRKAFHGVCNDRVCRPLSRSRQGFMSISGSFPRVIPPFPGLIEPAGQQGPSPQGSVAFSSFVGASFPCLLLHSPPTPRFPVPGRPRSAPDLHEATGRARMKSRRAGCSPSCSSTEPRWARRASSISARQRSTRATSTRPPFSMSAACSRRAPPSDSSRAIHR